MRKTKQTVLAVIRLEEKILLVRPTTMGETAWCLPGGVSHLGERLTLALRRTIQEQTGLRVWGEDLLVQVVRLISQPANLETKIYLFETKVADEALMDAGQATERGHIALFHSPKEYVTLLQQLKQVSLRDPIISYLSGETGPGCVWLYENQDGEEQLVTKQRSAGL